MAISSNVRINHAVIQATPFCNLACRYCYLPNRKTGKIIEVRTLSKIYERLFGVDYLAAELSLVWHAGEPLSVPIAFYESACSLATKFNNNNVGIKHVFQTNATLITQSWCDFFRAHDVRIGVSIDGPRRFHDRNRVTRGGRGSFECAMRGVQILQDNGLSFSNIAVLTSEALDCPDEIWEFFLSHGMTDLAFNTEEIEGIHLKSSLGRRDMERYQAFFLRISQLRKACPQRVYVRELETMEARIRNVSGEIRSAVNQPLGCLSFDVDGNISTFSPELQAVRHQKYCDFKFGNVFDHGINGLLENEAFRRANDDIQHGVAKCRASCPYFSVCGGGDPSNKLAENGTFVCTGTVHCSLVTQALCDTVLKGVEESLGIKAS